MDHEDPVQVGLCVVYKACTLGTCLLSPCSRYEFPSAYTGLQVLLMAASVPQAGTILAVLTRFEAL